MREGGFDATMTVEKRTVWPSSLIGRMSRDDSRLDSLDSTPLGARVGSLHACVCTCTVLTQL